MVWNYFIETTRYARRVLALINVGYTNEAKESYLSNIGW